MNNNKFKQTEIGEIPEDWEVNTISNFTVEIIDGDRGLNYPKQGELLPDGYCLFLSTKNVPSDNFNFTERFFVTEDKDKLLRKGKLQREDIVLTTRGTVGNIALFDKKVPYNNIRINSGMVILRNKGKDFDLGFLYQLLKSGVLKRQYASFSSGSAQPQLPIKDLKSILLVKPSIVEQERIASFLLSLDDKIELNKKMNKTLEEIGKALFKRWFVDFEFPNDDGEPYKSSVGKMVDSELGDIPKNWEILQIGDVVTVKGGTTPSTTNPDYWENGIVYWATPKDLSVLQSSILFDTERKITEKGLKTIGSGLLPINSILLSSRAPIGYLAITNIPVAINQGFIGIVCDKGIPSYYLYFWLKYYMDLIKNMANGSTFLEISKSNFKQIMFIKPSVQSLKKFEQLTASLFPTIIKNELEINTLTKIRGSLLPRLMSGKLRIKDYEN